MTLHPAHRFIYTLDGAYKGNHMDAQYLANVAKLTIQARKQGIRGPLTARPVYGGDVDSLKDASGETWVLQNDGYLESLTEIDRMQDYDPGYEYDPDGDYDYDAD